MIPKYFRHAPRESSRNRSNKHIHLSSLFVDFVATITMYYRMRSLASKRLSKEDQRWQPFNGDLFGCRGMSTSSGSSTRHMVSGGSDDKTGVQAVRKTILWGRSIDGEFLNAAVRRSSEMVLSASNEHLPTGRNVGANMAANAGIPLFRRLA